MRHRTDRRQNTRGQALTEMVIAVPLTIVAMCGVIEFGRLLFSWLTVQHAARVATRTAITGQGEQDGTRLSKIVAAASTAASTLPGTPPFVTVRSWAGTTASGAGRTDNPGQPCELIEVGVRYTYQPVIPLISSLMPNNGQIQLFGKDRKLNEPWVPCP